MNAGHDPMIALVDENGTFATHCLADERQWIARHVERRRMKLHELEIDEASAGTRRDRDARATRVHRIRREAIQAADSSGGEHDRSSFERFASTVRVANRQPRRSAGVVEHDVERPRAFKALDRFTSGGRRHERAYELRPGCVAAGAENAAA